MKREFGNPFYLVLEILVQTLHSEDSEISKHDNMIKSANLCSMFIHACPCVKLTHPYFI